jgi:hypothetical protein
LEEYRPELAAAVDKTEMGLGVEVKLAVFD